MPRRGRLEWGEVRRCAMCSAPFATQSRSGKICAECKDPKSPAGRWTQIKNDAKRRRISFKLSIFDIKRFWQAPCVYCGSSTPTVNLDRVDSEYGYVIGNVVPCCPECNHLKGKFDVDDFLSTVQRIAEWQAQHPANIPRR